jgi:hypothetical protein
MPEETKVDRELRESFEAVVKNAVRPLAEVIASVDQFSGVTLTINRSGPALQVEAKVQLNSGGHLEFTGKATLF